MGDEFKDKSITIDGNSQPGRTRRQPKHGTQLILAKFVEPAFNPKQHALALISDQGRW
jgi:hypothetical protein